jgi:integrase
MSVMVKPRGSKWWLYVNHKGKRVCKSIGTKQAAEKVRVQIEAQLALGDLSAFEKPKPEQTVPTFAEVAAAWPKWSQELFPVRPSTQRGRESFTRVHLTPWFGPRLISDVTRASIQEFIAKKRVTGLADSAINVGLNTLRLILGYAVERGDIPANPMRSGARLWKAGAAELPDPFTRSELAAILMAADVIDERWGLFLTAWAASGMRSGEIRGLEAGDLVDGTLRIRRTYTHHTLGPTKTARGDRNVPIRDAALLGQIIAQASPDPAAPLFQSLKAPGRLNEREMYTLWTRTVKAAGIRYRAIETLRHTGISIKLSDGEPLLRVAQESGHSPGVMLKSYAKWVDGSNNLQPPRSTNGQVPEMTHPSNLGGKFTTATTRRPTRSPGA